MYMHTRLSTKAAEIDPAILDRISEAEIHAWFIARLNLIRATGLPAHTFELDAWYRGDDDTLDTSYTMHACGECVTGAATIEAACAQLNKLLYGNPAHKAAEKKREAAELLKQAAALDALALQVSAAGS